MAEVLAFRGMRYNPEKVKDVGQVLAPPYDIISAEEQARLYHRHPYNVVRLILGRIYSRDDKKINRYTRAGKLFQDWITKKVLVADESPCIYVYSQEYRINGRRQRRLGFVACLKLDDGEGCLPHERTLAKPKEDRMKLIRQVKANLSPIFSFYIDKAGIVERTVSEGVEGKPLYEFSDQEGVRHRFWKIADPKRISRIRNLMRKKQVFIADGHHRFEVARANWVKQNKAESAGAVMMYFTGFSAENLCVLPTHRMLKKVTGLEKKLEKLEEYFEKVPARDLKHLVKLQEKATGFSIGLYYRRRFFLLRLKDEGVLKKLLSDVPVLWRELDVVMLNRVVFEHILGLNEKDKEEKISYTRDAEIAVKRVNGGSCQAAFFPNATKPEQVKQIALSHSRMPQKSTYFYPKPITGLVINKF